ncbi:hypothetical protein F6456_16605 [Streptomyces sp. LBUM 1484]|nr:hypothetical protein [Streptomyces sp. LBUM 1484]
MAARLLHDQRPPPRPYHAAWAARENGVGEHIAPAYPPGLENLTGLDAPTCLDAWGNVHRAFPPALRSRRCLRGVTADPARGSALRAPDGTPLIPLHPVTVTEQDLRALKRVRRALRAGAKANPSLLVTHHPDGSADIESVPSPGAYAGTVDRTVAVLTLAPDQDVATLAAALTPTAAPSARTAAGPGAHAGSRSPRASTRRTTASRTGSPRRP